MEIYSPELKRMQHPDIPAIPGYVRAKEEPEKSDKYPLQLIGLHPIERCHTVHYNNEELREKYPQQLWMNLEDGQVRGLQTGDMVEVWNDRGEMRVPVLLTMEIDFDKIEC